MKTRLEFQYLPSVPTQMEGVTASKMYGMLKEFSTKMKSLLTMRKALESRCDWYHEKGGQTQVGNAHVTHWDADNFHLDFDGTDSLDAVIQHRIKLGVEACDHRFFIQAIQYFGKNDIGTTELEASLDGRAVVGWKQSAHHVKHLRNMNEMSRIHNQKLKDPYERIWLDSKKKKPMEPIYEENTPTCQHALDDIATALTELDLLVRATDERERKGRRKRALEFPAEGQEELTYHRKTIRSMCLEMAE